MSKPKLILHIGHGKTGTTSLQNFLVKNSSKLIKLGYLYPVTRSPRHNHVLLPAGFIHTKHLVAHEHQVYEGDVNWFKQDYYYFWTALINDIKQYTPHTVILSAEQMFRDFSAISKIELRDFLSDHFSEVTVVAYIRSPLKDYLSRISQQIRTGLNKITPRTRSIRNVIEYYESQFPGQVYLYAFEGSQLVKGDLIYDFVTHNMPDAVKLCVVKKTSDNNVALSWELLQTLRKLRLQVQPTGKVPSISTRMFIARITRSNIHNTKASTKLKPKLIPEVQAYLTRSSVDYLWLRDKYNVVFFRFRL